VCVHGSYSRSLRTCVWEPSLPKGRRRIVRENSLGVEKEKRESPGYLQCPPFYKPREDLHVKITRESTRYSRAQGRAFSVSWAPPSSGVAVTVNLSHKLGASGSSLAVKEQLVGDGDSELSRSDEAKPSRSCEVVF
jgi:hypothetical protein